MLQITAATNNAFLAAGDQFGKISLFLSHDVPKNYPIHNAQWFLLLNILQAESI